VAWEHLGTWQGEPPTATHASGKGQNSSWPAGPQFAAATIRGLLVLRTDGDWTGVMRTLIGPLVFTKLQLVTLAGPAAGL
jgi:hypothetical protein